MNEYNERILKNVLQDIREENDAQFLKEIEEAANDPRFKNSEDEARKFANKYNKAKKKKFATVILKVAVVLVVFSIGVAVIPVPVNGTKETIAQLIANFVNSEYIAIDNGEDDSLLLTYQGQYVPTYIPEGYKVESVNNATDRMEIVLKNSEGNMIVFGERSLEMYIRVDSNEISDVKYNTINGYESFSYIKDGVKHLVITTENVVLLITCEDLDFDLISFAELIEKR